MKVRDIIISIFCLAVFALAGCSRGGGESPAPPPQLATTLNGMASKGPIQAGTVKVYAVSFGAPDLSAPIAQAQTDTGGNYSIDVGSYAGPALVEITGGTFVDEVSGTTITIKTPLHVAVADIKTADTTIAAVTPMTELAFRKAMGAGQLTADSINSANAAVASTFGLKDVVSILPTTNNGDADGKKYAAACGAFSQLLNDNKGANESLDDALARLMTQMGDEEEHAGKLSMDSVVILNRAISAFGSSVNNATGATLDTLPMPTSGVLKFATTGARAPIFGIDVTIALPQGVIVDADPLTGETAAGVVTISGLAAVGSNTLSVAKYTPAAIGTPAQVHIVLLNSAGFGLGEFVSIQFSTTAGATFPLSSQFSAVSFLAKGSGGAGLTGVAAAPLSVEGI